MFCILICDRNLGSSKNSERRVYIFLIFQSIFEDLTKKVKKNSFVTGEGVKEGLTANL